jgi:hypothetical protein
MDRTSPSRLPAPDGSGVTPQRLYAGAYFTTLTSALLSGWLTYTYVQAGARELNPVMLALIATLGIEAATLVKVGVVVTCFHGYSFLAGYCSPPVVVGFAWLAAAVHLADAAFDLGVAVTTGWIPLYNATVGGALVLAVGGLGVLFRPPAVVLPDSSAEATQQ